jgi:hypothetical protein
VNGTRRVVEHSTKAREFTSRAANIEAAAEHAIYSDDADAIKRLTERIAGLESERGTIKAYNAACRKGTADPRRATGQARTRACQQHPCSPGSSATNADAGHTTDGRQTWATDR